MPAPPDYSSWNAPELAQEVKRLRRQELWLAGWSGFVMGIMLFGLVTAGFGWLYTVIPLLLLGVNARTHRALRIQIRRIQKTLAEKEAAAA
jgi:hypothetical protein